ncbi:hypothetical protein ACROQ8_004741 [Yersinia enterocolitica]|nr:hypothetical protein [Yersinia enterocolitica]
MTSSDIIPPRSPSDLQSALGCRGCALTPAKSTDAPAACPTPRRPGKNFPIDPTFLFTCDVNVWIFFPGLPIFF